MRRGELVLVVVGCRIGVSGSLETVRTLILRSEKVSVAAECKEPGRGGRGGRGGGGRRRQRKSTIWIHQVFGICWNLDTSRSLWLD